MEDSNLLIIDSDASRRACLTEFLKTHDLSSKTALSLHAGLRGLRPADPALLLIALADADPEKLAALKQEFPFLGTLLLSESEDPDSLRILLEKKLVDQILPPHRSLGILAAIRSEFARLHLIKANRDYRRTIRNLEALKREHQDKNRELEEIYGATLENLMTALDIRDVETFGHSRTVAKYAGVLTSLLGVSDPARLKNIHRGALLHDIGKIAIPDAILKKSAPLSPQEWKKIRLHPQLGYGLIKEIKLVEEVGNIILRHHERYDGQGYPDGKQGDDIPLEARIFAVADALDAITSHRPYRKMRPFAEAREEIQDHAGSQFDPGIVEAFCSLELSKWEKVRFESTRLLPSFESFLEAVK